uniref:Uncharacterized protein n=1 Tax=Cannabis sativa TaxID=3483 RepID=A0A803QPA1_CANSA
MGYGEDNCGIVPLNEKVSSRVFREASRRLERSSFRLACSSGRSFMKSWSSTENEFRKLACPSGRSPMKLVVPSKKGFRIVCSVGFVPIRDVLSDCASSVWDICSGSVIHVWRELDA